MVAVFKMFFFLFFQRKYHKRYRKESLVTLVPLNSRRTLNLNQRVSLRFSGNSETTDSNLECTEKNKGKARSTFSLTETKFTKS